MKKKCAVCSEAKGKRACSLHGGEQVCPRCCASIRGDDCMGCPHFSAAQRYQAGKLTRTAIKREREDTFTVEINPRLDDEIDAALEMIEAGRFRKGAKIISAISKQFPNYHTVMYANGIVHLKRGRTDDALACFNAAAEIFPPLTSAQFNRGLPRHHQSLGNLGICYAMLGQKKRAIEALDKALELNPSYEFALRNRSLIERLDEGEPLS